MEKCSRKAHFKACRGLSACCSLPIHSLSDAGLLEYEMKRMLLIRNSLLVPRGRVRRMVCELEHKFLSNFLCLHPFQRLYVNLNRISLGCFRGLRVRQKKTNLAFLCNYRCNVEGCYMASRKASFRMADHRFASLEEQEKHLLLCFKPHLSC